MTFKTKHNIKRKFIRMSWNKYNIYILLKFHKIRSLIKKWALKSKNLYKHRLLNKQRLKRYYGYLTENQLQKFYKKSLKISLLNYKNTKKKTNFKLKKKKQILYFNKIKKTNKKKFFKGKLKKVVYKKKLPYFMYDRNKTSISIPNNNFYSLLESRLDSVLFRIYFAPSIFSSRQLINHGHILVNNIKITNPSFILKPMDIIMIKPNSFKKVNKLLLLKDTKKNKIKKFLLEKYKLLCIPKYTMVNYRILCAVFIRKPKMSEIPYPFRIKKNSIKNFYRTKFFYRNKLLFFK